MSELISREDALKVIRRNRHRLEGAGQTYRFMIDQMEHIPTVDAEPVKRGHWIHHRDWGIDGECPVECSECGMGEDCEMNYCCRCGAKMERSRA